MGLGLATAVAVPSAHAAATTPIVSVSATADLNPDGQQLVVTGSGFDETIGIYIAVCVDNGPGELPTPCIGGVDTTGAASSSAWISSNPPSYAEGLTTPYGPGGSFEVALQVVAGDPKLGVDCREVACAVVTRADHTRTDDRSQDTRTPVTFAAAAASADPTPAGTGPPTASAPPSAAAPSATARLDGPVTAAAPEAPAAAAPTETSTSVVANPNPGSEVPGWLWLVGALAAVGVAVGLPLRRARQRVATSPSDPLTGTIPRGPTA